MFKIVFTQRAEESLEEIIDFYLIKYSRERAEKVVASIDEGVKMIARTPKIFPQSFDIGAPKENIRQAIIHDTFKVIFRISDSKIEILEIFHGNRNPSLLKDLE